MNTISDNSINLFDSWSSLVDADTQIKCTERKYINEPRTETSTNNDNIADEITIVDNIMALNISELAELDILNYQKYISGKIKKHILCCINKTHFFDSNVYIKKLEWLSNTSHILSVLHGFREIIHSKKNNNGIPRNSYKFCTHGAKCIFKYQKKKCRNQHFVYNNVKSDIDAVIEYIKEKKEDPDLTEISTSLNTIAFVFNHMYDEIKK